MARGLVIGKFYPPHRGHKYLIDVASAQVDKLDVVLCVRPDQRIPGALRAAWLREIHPAANVVEAADLCDDDNSRRWADYTKQLLGHATDVVFSSEDYGDAFADFLGAKHVKVDRVRAVVPISGSEIRKDPFAHWQYLEPCVCAWFCKRICVVGAESTGTTTTARLLAERFRTLWVPEYGRDYTEARRVAGAGVAWRTEEFVHIARRQQEHEDLAARQADRVLFCDTDALATCVWHERYLGAWSNEVEAVADTRRYDHYLVTATDVPFEHDRIRDSEHLREWMTCRFVEEIRKRGYPVTVLEGPLDQRLATATRIVAEVMKEDPYRDLRVVS